MVCGKAILASGVMATTRIELCFFVVVMTFETIHAHDPYFHEREGKESCMRSSSMLVIVAEFPLPSRKKTSDK